MIIFLHGEDSFRIQEKITSIKDKFSQDIDLGGNSIFIIDGGSSPLAKIKETINTGSLFTKKKLVIIKNIFANSDQSIFDELKKLCLDQKLADSEDAILFIDDQELNKLPKAKQGFLKYLQEQKFVQEFKPLTNAQLAKWIRDRVQSEKKEIQPAAVQRLTTILGNDLWRLNNELHKLFHHSDNIDDKLITEMVKGDFDDNIFALTDALAAKNKATALQLLETQHQAGSSYEYILAMFLRQYKIMLQIKQALEQGWDKAKISKDLGLHSFVVQKGMQQARNFNLPDIKRMINKLIDIEYLSKLGQADVKTELALFIAQN